MLVVVVPLSGLIWFVLHHPPRFDTIMWQVFMLLMFSAMQAQKETGDKRP